MLLTVPINRRRNQRGQSKDLQNILMPITKKELTTLDIRNLLTFRGPSKMVPPLRRESRTVTAITVDSRGTGHPIVPLKTFLPTMKSSGPTLIA